ncbi:hypothetical protein TrVE_jg9851 [Triparma verrucosa]|uniref:Protein kinase domain-containing protein n=1 Tax=Triparma verrucosa TaxID=1606542 RepID=A0A9W7KUI6_9STRA|nr:hypothetical protein TrVE_jg9851 [Triparma verrucosa]
MGSGQSGVALTVEECLGPDQLSLDEIDVLNELPSHVFTTNIVVNGMDEVDIFLSLKYVCKLTEQASTPEHMQYIVESARDFNESNDIRGEICLLNLFDQSYCVTQTIEGPVRTVVLLWNRIKADPRIREIVQSSYSLKGQRDYTSWNLSMRGAWDGGGRFGERNFMSQHCKRRILQQNRNKTVYVVEDMRTNKHYVMKETILVEMMPGLNLPCTNESDLLRHIYANNNYVEGNIGIISAPDVFQELSRISMVFPLYDRDLYNAVKDYTSRHESIGLPDQVVVTYIAQLLEALLILKERGIVHRDIKPENICLDENGNLVLLDFDNAMRAPQSANPDSNHASDNASNHAHETPSVLIGAPLFVTPETFRRLEYSYSTDLWSVAVVGCELHSSRLPWNVSTNMSIDEIGMTILIRPAVKPRTMNDELWRFLNGIFMNSQQRISLEEAIEDPIFTGFTFGRHDEVTGDFIPGNIFDRHDHLQEMRVMCQTGGHLSEVTASSSRKRFLAVQTNNENSMIGRDRGEFVQSWNTL